MGQSLGLHVESAPNCNPKESWMADPAHRRRTWYSMYVLDRLLALQLGRPMAIHEADFQVDLPSLDDSSAFCQPGYEPSPQSDSNTRRGCMMDYFLQVIRFSHIVGLAIQNLYQPSQIDLSPDQMLQNASGLDYRLVNWKLGLPRHLRFDLGHTFEKSISFKRQVSYFETISLQNVYFANRLIAKYARCEIPSSSRSDPPPILMPPISTNEQSTLH